jgi:TRAP-type transport system periplasmic protein
MLETESTHPIRVAGYQGPDSLLTTSLRHLTNGLRTQNSHWILTLEEDITARGETARSMFSSIDCGVRHIGYMASGYLVAQVSELALLDLPFAIQDRGLALRVLDGEVGTWLTGCIEQRTGYKVLGYWDNGFRHLSNKVRPISSASDCADLRIRTLDSAIYRQSLGSMGFSPISIDVKDFPDALKRGTVDAQENPLANFALFSVGSYHPYLSLSAHFYGVLLLVCHRAWFEKLSIHEQTVLQTAAASATALQRELAAAEDAQTLKALHDRGIAIIDQSGLDMPSFRRATQHVHDQVSRTLPAKYVRSYVQHEQVALLESAAA